jgi:tRNA 2-selenouridine synthase
LANAIDLEGLAKQRGSSIGRKVTAQHTQINFENALAYELIQKLDKGFGHIVFEDEGRNVGSVYMPKPFAAYLAEAPRVILETSTQERVETTFNEYVLDAQQMYSEAGYPLKLWQEDIQSAMNRIKNRMGGVRHQKVCAIFEDAVAEHQRSGSLDAYKAWAEYLLTEYYDPMYDYQIQKRSDQIAFRGSSEAVLEYLAEL